MKGVLLLQIEAETETRVGLEIHGTTKFVRLM
jgi:hypothetical protein